MSEKPRSSLRCSVTTASHLELHAVIPHDDSRRLYLRPLGRAATQNRVRVVEVHEHRTLRAEPRQELHAPPRSAHREVAHLARRGRVDTCRLQLAVRPEGAVEE